MRELGGLRLFENAWRGYTVPMQCSWVWIRVFWIGFAVSIFGGGGPLNTLVIVNQSSRESMHAGQYYQAARGLPADHLCPVTTTTNSWILLADFQDQIWTPVTNWMAECGMTEQIDTLVLSRDFPYRVRSVSGGRTNHNGITSVLFYGFQSYPAVTTCELPISTLHDYFEADAAFSQTNYLESGYRLRMAAALEGFTLEESLAMIDRSVSADSRFPTGRVELIKTLDVFRNIRWTQHEDTDFAMKFLPNDVEVDMRFEADIRNRTNLVGVSFGFPGMRSLLTNDFEAGCIGDHLTSYGGALDDSKGQMTVLEFIRAGCSGSYGTVVEPCNYIQKFPRIRVHHRYGLGYSMAEAYYQSIQSPYMGIIVGDPLTAPFARRPSAVFLSTTNHQVLSGSYALDWQASADPELRVGGVDLYLDGRWFTNLFDATPDSGTEVSVGVSGTSAVYTVQSGDGLAEIVSGLASVVNASNWGVIATAEGGRVELVQENAMASCSNWSLSASSSDSTHFWIAPASTNFLEAEYPARMKIELEGVPSSGDVVRLAVQRLDGVWVTNQVVAATNATAKSLTGDLLDILRTDTNLQGVAGCTASDYEFELWNPFTWTGELFLLANTPGWTGLNMSVDFDVISSSLDDTSTNTFFNHNLDVMGGRARWVTALGPTSVVASVMLPTTNWANGFHQLTLVARGGDETASQGYETLDLVVSNSTWNTWIDVPSNGATFRLGALVTAEVYAAGGTLTQLQVHADGRLLVDSLTSPVSLVITTLQFGVGAVELQATAFAEDGQRARSAPVDVDILRNLDLDFDELDDEWEIFYFGSVTNYTGGDDPDEDGYDNRMEFCAGVDPLDSNSIFNLYEAEVYSSTQLVFRFQSGSSYLYQVETPVFDGDGIPVDWVSVDTVTAVSATSTWTHPLQGSSSSWYRIRSECPDL